MRMTVGYIVYETAHFKVQFSVQKSYTWNKAKNFLERLKTIQTPFKEKGLHSLRRHRKAYKGIQNTLVLVPV